MRKTPVTAALIVREPQTKAHEVEMEGIALTAMTRQRNWSISIAGWFLNFLLTLHILMTCCRKSGCAGSYSPVNSHSSTRFTVSASISHSRLLSVSETVSMGRQREIHSSKNCVKALANSVSSESMQQHVANNRMRLCVDANFLSPFISSAIAFFANAGSPYLRGKYSLMKSDMESTPRPLTSTSSWMSLASMI